MSNIPDFLSLGRVRPWLIVVNLLMAQIYLLWWLNLDLADNYFLFGLLVFGEIYHVLMAVTFWHNIWPGVKNELKPTNIKPNLSVDIFIPVVSEPIEVIRQTVQAALALPYQQKQVYLLNDGRVAGYKHWNRVEALAQELGCSCITRTTPGGAKAGNINHALAKTNGDLVVIFDADMIVKPSFLRKTLPYFAQPDTGFVQTPQYYSNHADNKIASGAWEQQAFFFGTIMKGKERFNGSFICGTNVIIRRQALMAVGGFDEENIAEDFLTSLKIHQQGWKSYYLTDVLATGLAPQDPMSYYTQQLRWARGSIQVLFSHNPLLTRGLTWQQRIGYFSSALFYLNGLVVLINMAMPVLYLFLGWTPVGATTTVFAVYFLPFMFLTLYTLYLASDGTLTFPAMSFSQSSWTIQIMALWSIITGKKISFQVTPKQAQAGNYWFLIYPHLIYIGLVVGGASLAIWRESLTPAVAANLAWGIVNALMFLPFILAVVEKPSNLDQKIVQPKIAAA